jgi:hypothetical protein
MRLISLGVKAGKSFGMFVRSVSLQEGLRLPRVPMSCSFINWKEG